MEAHDRQIRNSLGPMLNNDSNRNSNTSWIGRLVVAAIAVVTGIAVWQTQGTGPGSSLVAVVRTPVGIMGTTCTLVAVVPQGRVSVAQKGLKEAEGALRRVDALMSTYIDESEVSIVNRAPAGVAISLSPPTLAVVAASREFSRATAGAFDPTCRPLVDIWRRAGKNNRIPSEEERLVARESSSWADFEGVNGGLRKTRAGARLDLGGVAKGFGIDRAFEALEAVGCQGILVDVGGDVRVGGLDDRGEKWKIVVRDPFSLSALSSFELEAGAVCTSGSYERFVEIDGERFSHIIDPRTAFPVRRLPSVTVLAENAISADAWATALSVRGPEGLVDLPRGIEVMMVAGDELRCTIQLTPAMKSLLGVLPDLPCDQGIGELQ